MLGVTDRALDEWSEEATPMNDELRNRRRAKVRNQLRVHRPFTTSLLWHLGGVVTKVLWAILEEVGKCLK